MRALLLLSLLPACVDYDLNGKDDDPGHSDDTKDGGPDTDTTEDRLCDTQTFPADAVGATDECDAYEVGGFDPVIKWGVRGKYSTALPVVGDLDGDGMPEIVVVWSGLLPGQGTLAVYHGDGTEVWTDETDNIGYGSAPAIADLDDDGVPEILVNLDHGSGMSLAYAVGCFDPDGNELWETDDYTGGEFNWATGIAVSDMDHDGSPEIVAGRMIFNWDGSVRAEGRGSSIGSSDGFGSLIEGAHPAIADLDLDGEEEVVTGDLIYDIDGNVLHRNSSGDGAVSIGNFDSDPEGEYVATHVNTIRLHDTDGTEIWSKTNAQANIFSSPAVGDLDGDGIPEIVVAGGNEIWAMKADGTMLWTQRAHDSTGATGASIFDFDADGIPEVVYIDEVAMYAFNGTDGTLKFKSEEHDSVTMFDYPVVADVDVDGHADIVVADEGTYGLVVYEDATNSWAPARSVWNQHAYSITNINDDLSVPVTATQNFTLYNNFHAGVETIDGELLNDELQSEILDVCEEDCDSGWLHVWGRGLNAGAQEVPAGLSLALYGEPGDVLLDTAVTTRPTPAEETTESVEFVVDASLLDGVTSLLLAVDDDGTGTSAVAECVELNNTYTLEGRFCR